MIPSLLFALFHCVDILCVCVCVLHCVKDMGEFLVEGQQLKEELRQIVDYKQGRSLARYRMNKNRHDGCDVDAFVAFPLVSFSFCLFVPFAP